MTIKKGQTYMKNGVMIDIHEVRDGQVFYRLWPPRIEKQGMFDRLYRMPIGEFKSKLNDEGGEKTTCKESLQIQSGVQDNG